MDGILLVDKPSEWTSMDVCAHLRGVLHERHIGHTGTLDPNATTAEPLKLDASFGAGRLPMVVLLAVIVILMLMNTTSPIRKYPPQLTVALVRVGTVKAVGNLLFNELRKE